MSTLGVRALSNWQVPDDLKGPMVYPFQVWRSTELGEHSSQLIAWRDMPGFKETVTAVLSADPIHEWMKRNHTEIFVVRARPGYSLNLLGGGVIFVLDGCGFSIESPEGDVGLPIGEGLFYGVEPGGDWVVGPKGSSEKITLLVVDRIGERITRPA